MRPNQKFSNLLWTLTGEDKTIIKITHPDIKKKFFYIGFLVLFIVIISFSSSFFFAFSLLSGLQALVSVPIALLWGALIGLLYVFLLYTISPTFLPKGGDITKGDNSRIKVFEHNLKDNFGINIMRFAAIGGIAFIIAQPINEKLFLNSFVDKYNLSNAPSEFKENKLRYKADIIESSFIYSFDNEKSVFQDLADDSLILNDFNNKAFFNILLKKYLTDSLTVYQIKNNLSKVDSLGNLYFSSSKRRLKRSIIDQTDYLIEKHILSCKSFLMNYNPPLIFRNDSSFYYDNQRLIKEYAKVSTVFSDQGKYYNYFYLLSLKSVFTSSIGSYFVTVVVIFAFLLPLYLKFKLRFTDKFWKGNEIEFNHELKKMRNTMFGGGNWFSVQGSYFTITQSDMEKIKDFYFIKAIVEAQIIYKAYQRFKRDYSVLLKDYVENSIGFYKKQLLQDINSASGMISDLKVENIFNEYRNYGDINDGFVYPEPWLDPPFNTIPPILEKSKRGELQNAVIYNDFFVNECDQDGLRKINKR